jgi:hypothetical protein
MDKNEKLTLYGTITGLTLCAGFLIWVVVGLCKYQGWIT